MAWDGKPRTHWTWHYKVGEGKWYGSFEHYESLFAAREGALDNQRGDKRFQRAGMIVIDTGARQDKTEYRVVKVIREVVETL